MRVLIINTSEKTGGAAIAARRLMESLHTAGTDVKMLVLHKESQSEQVIPVGMQRLRQRVMIFFILLSP